MNKTLTLGLIGAAISIGACHHSNLSTAQQERTQMRESGSETAQAGVKTGRNAADTARNLGSGVVHGVEAAGHGTVAGAQYVAHGVSRDDTKHLEQARHQSSRMNAQGETSGQRFSESGRDAMQTGRSAGHTAVHAGQTTVHAGEHAVGTVRRATGEHPHTTHSVRGGGPSAAPRDNVDLQQQRQPVETAPYDTNK